MKITDHAIERYRERVAPLPDDPEKARAEMRLCLAAAKPKHLKHSGKRTGIVPTGCCFFICSYGSVVSVVKELNHRRESGSKLEPIEAQAVSTNPALLVLC